MFTGENTLKENMDALNPEGEVDEVEESRPFTLLMLPLILSKLLMQELTSIAVSLLLFSGQH